MVVLALIAIVMFIKLGKFSAEFELREVVVSDLGAKEDDHLEIFTKLLSSSAQGSSSSANPFPPMSALTPIVSPPFERLAVFHTQAGNRRFLTVAAVHRFQILVHPTACGGLYDAVCGRSSRILKYSFCAEHPDQVARDEIASAVAFVAPVRKSESIDLRIEWDRGNDLADRRLCGFLRRCDRCDFGDRLCDRNQRYCKRLGVKV